MAGGFAVALRAGCTKKSYNCINGNREVNKIKISISMKE
jgi:hypothetical protein